MAYFLKKTKRKNDIYLQIYFSYRDPDTKKPKHKSHKALGYVSDLIAQGIPDPIAHFQEEVDSLNFEYNAQKKDRAVKKIGEISPVRSLGYFPADSVLRRLDVRDDIELFSSTRKFRFSVYDCLRFLIFARMIHPCSKKKTTDQILPTIYNAPDFSYDQILECLDFIGNDYEKITEIFARHTDEAYILDSSTAFFDCTNYYFEIDREDEWRRKGPSKENRRDPIIGMGLLLDGNCIPTAMRLYPGNQSEIPVLRQAINDLKKQSHITGRTVQVADKGLNCARNIYECIQNGDGYIFSKSVKKLDEKERTWVMNIKDWTEVTDPDDNSVKFKMYSCVDKFHYEFTDDNGRKVPFTVREKRLVTLNPKLRRKQKAEITKMVEKAKGCCLSQAKKSEYGESAKYVDFKSVGEDGSASDKKAVTTLNQQKIERDLEVCGYNMIVTSEIEMDDITVYKVYHQLWRIEESFRSLKTELDARPVYLQSINRIKGHFLVCYLAVLLERLVQFKVLEDKFGTHQVYEFIRKFKIVPYSIKEYTNLSSKCDIIDFIEKKYKLPVGNYYLQEKQIKKILEKPL